MGFIINWPLTPPAVALMERLTPLHRQPWLQTLLLTNEVCTSLNRDAHPYLTRVLQT